MSILAKYFSKEFFKLLLLFQFMLVSIYFIIDFIQKIPDFIERSIPMDMTLSYFLLKVPFIIIQTAPVATLLSVVLMFSLMEKRNEITAMKASGISIVQLSKPIGISSIFIAVAVFLFAELIVPYTSSRSNEIWYVDVRRKKERTRFYGHERIWYKGKDAIYCIESYNPEDKIMHDVTLYFFDDSFHLIKRIDALSGTWTEGKWKLREGMMQKANSEGEYDLERFNELDLELPEGPETFVRSVKKPEEMSYWQLKRYAKRVNLEGYDATTYLVDMNMKLAFPVINIVMVLLGIPIALRMKRRGTPLVVCVGIVGCFLYLLTLGFSRSLGLNGVLPPVLSAWLANIVFLFMGSYLILNTET